MNLTMLKCKIHRAKVTEANLNYEGSITIGRDLCQAAGLIPNEKVDIYNCDNGKRLATYVIVGEPGTIGLNGAAARMVHAGDRVIICSYGQMEELEAAKHVPTLVFVDENNKIKDLKTKEKHGTISM